MDFMNIYVFFQRLPEENPGHSSLIVVYLKVHLY